VAQPDSDKAQQDGAQDIRADFNPLAVAGQVQRFQAEGGEGCKASADTDHDELANCRGDQEAAHRHHQPVDGGGGRGRPQKAVGEGTIDWAKTFGAAKKGGVKNYFVEQNMELTKASVAALKAMKA